MLRVLIRAGVNQGGRHTNSTIQQTLNDLLVIVVDKQIKFEPVKSESQIVLIADVMDAFDEPKNPCKDDPFITQKLKCIQNFNLNQTR